MTRIRPLASLILALYTSGCVAFSGNTAGARQDPGLMHAAPANDFAARTLDGALFSLREHRGRVVVLLSFCTTWCEPCIAEMPHLRRLYSAYREQGLAMVAIAMDGPETIANVPAFARRNQINFPVITDEDSRISALYNPRKSAPLSILIDRAGRVHSIREGYNPGDEEALEQDIRSLLSAPRRDS